MNDHLQQKLKSNLLKANSNKKLALWFNLTWWWKGIMTSGNTKKKQLLHPLKHNYFQLLLTIPNYITFQNKKGQIDDTKVFLMVCCPKGFREGLLLLLLKTVISLGYTYFLTSSYMSQLRSTKMLERKPSKNNALHLQGKQQWSLNFSSLHYWPRNDQ